MSRDAERGKPVTLSTSSSRNTSGKSSSRLGSGRGAKRIFLVWGADCEDFLVSRDATVLVFEPVPLVDDV